LPEVIRWTCAAIFGLALLGEALTAYQKHSAEPEASAHAAAQLASSSPPASAVASAPIVAADDPCTTLCRLTSQLRCGKNQAECAAACAPMLAIPSCGKELARVFACSRA
jgi:hypothetical protein